MRPSLRLLGAAYASWTAAVPTYGRSNDFIAFGKSLGLDALKVQSLAATYVLATTPAGLLEVACLTAVSALGDAQVDTRPLNNATIQENW